MIEPSRRRETTNALEPEGQRPLSWRSGLGTWAVLLAAALAVRLLIYFRVENVLHVEEAIQGLMARHFLAGEIKPLAWGLPYLGTLQSAWIAACFAVFGSSVVVLKCAAGAESLALVAANYLLAREAAGGDRRAGLLAAILTAAGPLYLIEWSVRARGGYLEVATLSALALWALLRAVRSEPRPARRWLALCAFLLGLGFWVHLTMLYAMVACLIGTVLWGRRLLGDPRALLLAASVFLVGSLPFWLFNVKYPGRTFAFVWQTLQTSPGGAGFSDHLAQSARVSIPILLGSRQMEAEQSFGMAVVLLALAATGLALAAAVAASRAWSRIALHAERRQTVSGNGIALLIVFAATGLCAFLLGPFSDQAKDPRSLLPLYAALPTLAAIGISYWSCRNAVRRNTAWLTFCAILLAHVAGYRRAGRDVVQPRTRGGEVPTILDPVKDVLQSHNVTRVFADFSIGYRLAFETNERVIACTDQNPDPERYPPYAAAVRESSQPPAFIADPRAAVWLRAVLQSRKIGFQAATVQEYQVVHSLTDPYLDYPLSARICLPATIAVAQYPRQAVAGTTFTAEVTVTNRSLIEWPAPTEPSTVRLSYHLLDPDTGKSIQYEYPRCSLGRAVRPGESVRVNLEIEAPTSPGRYAFVPDLIVEDMAWLSLYQPSIVDKTNWHDFGVIAQR